MPDFTLNTLRRLFTALKGQLYTFQTFALFLRDPARRTIILRHDVDARKMNSLQTALLEKELGIAGTYNFRIVPESFDPGIIKQIADLGHEIGYHYEDVSSTAERQKCEEKGCTTQDTRLREEELAKAAIENFKDNLERLREIVPVKTICMHGSPMSRWDNRLLWKYYDYRDFGLIGEPYFDVDFNEILYLTDTGRRWDGDSVNIRDKAHGTGHRAQGVEQRAESGERRAVSEEQSATLYNLNSTFDIIDAAKESRLPDKIMLTIHPQRWDNRPLPWIRELVWQNVKNVGKRFIVARQ